MMSPLNKTVKITILESEINTTEQLSFEVNVKNILDASTEWKKEKQEFVATRSHSQGRC